MIKTSAEIRKWPPHKSCVSWLSEMSLVGCRNKLPVSWDTAIWCGTRNLGNFIFSLVRSLSFAVVRLPNWPYKKGTGLSPWFIEEQTEAQSEMQLDLSSTGTTGGVRIWTQAVLPMTLNGLFHSNLQLHQIPQLVGTSESGKEQGHSCLVIPPLFAFYILCGSHISPTSDFLCFPHWWFFHQRNYVDSHLTSHVATPMAQSWLFSFHIFMGNYIELQHLLFSADPQFCISLELSSQFSFQILRQPGLFCKAIFPSPRLHHLQLNLYL